MNKIFECEEKPRGMIQMFLIDGRQIYTLKFERKMIFNQKIADNIKYRFSNMNVMNVKEKEKIIVALLQTT